MFTYRVVFSLISIDVYLVSLDLKLSVLVLVSNIECDVSQGVSKKGEISLVNEKMHFEYLLFLYEISSSLIYASST